MKPIIIAFIGLFALLQYQLWFSKGGIISTWKLDQKIAQQRKINHLTKRHNSILNADIKDLKSGKEAVEERARNELGMIHKGEVFYQVVK